ncbi:MAG: hypothetical protein OEY28_10275, partial [Nitrospira sp.]|nr:hypothetical protein [Nitrospira sp.]
MRRLSRSEFDRFSALLRDLYTVPDSDDRLADRLANLQRLIQDARMSGNKKDGNQQTTRAMTVPSNPSRRSITPSDSPPSILPSLFSRLRHTRTVQQRAFSALLRPHLVHALRKVSGISRLLYGSALLNTTLNALGLAAIRLDSSGQVLESDTRATRLLSHYCAGRVGAALPEIVREWFVSQRSGRGPKHDTFTPSRLMTLERDHGELAIRLVQGDQEWWLLLQERRNEDLIQRLRAAGLTAREAEVLLWVSKGK